MAEGWTAQGNAAQCDCPLLDSNGPLSPLPSVNMSPQIRLKRQRWVQALLLLAPMHTQSEELSSNLLMLFSVSLHILLPPCVGCVHMHV